MRHTTLVALTVLLLAPIPAAALDPAHEDLAPLSALEENALRSTTGRVHALRAPLLARPAFTLPGIPFDVEAELAPGTLLGMSLVRGAVTCSLSLTPGAVGPSAAWADLPALRVLHVRAVPGACPPGLYDLHLSYTTPVGRTEERQVRAVRIMDAARYHALASGAAHPRIVVIADLEIGGTGALAQQAAYGDPAGLRAVADGTLGDGSSAPSGLWKAARAALAEARALDPDLVLVAGDLASGQLAPATYAAEYEEMWRVLAGADVPLFVAPGDRDGSFANGQDGFAYWRAYIGPTYTLAPAVPGTRFLALNTYDWSELDRAGSSDGVTAWGGQVREAQLAWMDTALGALRASTPGDRVVAVMHHSPAWRQDTLDEGWSGRNRLAVRDLLRAHDVEVVFAGHTHHDRVARDDGAGGIVGTFQTTSAMPPGFDPRPLHRWGRDDALLAGETQDELAERLRADTGPLYVDTTTAMGETTQYWGFRAVEIAYGADGRLDLARFGHPLTQAELEDLAAHPQLYDVAHASLGLFSRPLRLNAGAPWTSVPT